MSDAHTQGLVRAGEPHAILFIENYIICQLYTSYDFYSSSNSSSIRQAVRNTALPAFVVGQVQHSGSGNLQATVSRNTCIGGQAHNRHFSDEVQRIHRRKNCQVGLLVQNDMTWEYENPRALRKYLRDSNLSYSVHSSRCTRSRLRLRANGSISLPAQTLRHWYRCSLAPELPSCHLSHPLSPTSTPQTSPNSPHTSSSHSSNPSTSLPPNP